MNPGRKRCFITTNRKGAKGANSDARLFRERGTFHPVRFIQNGSWNRSFDQVIAHVQLKHGLNQQPSASLSPILPSTPITPDDTPPELRAAWAAQSVDLMQLMKNNRQKREGEKKSSGMFAHSLTLSRPGQRTILYSLDVDCTKQH